MSFTPLLTTKLYRPRMNDNWIQRHDLIARLDSGLMRKLILLSAPPGFGKSTLVSQWLDHIDSNAAFAIPTSNIKNLNNCWLSLDESDNQLVLFLRYLIAAVQTCEPTACPTTQSLLGAAQSPGVDHLADVIVSELNRLTAELILVLDDYHLIRSAEVHQVMRHLLRYMPPQLHLVIISRTDPPLHLGRLRIEQQITELRSADLRFAVEETRKFLDRLLDHSLENDVLKLLQDRTEGWVTALKLSSIALQSQDPHQFLDRFHGSDRLLIGYLVEEVLERQTAPMRDFLLRTALVDRFCAPLADALLTDRPLTDSSQTLIAQLEAQNLFVIPLDQHGEWLRYHDLFRDFLRHQLKRTESPETLALLHKAASLWYAEKGQIDDALHHALSAGDDAAAAELVITHLHSMLDRQIPALTLTRWLDLFPAATIQRHPGLLLAQLWLSAFGIASVGPPVQLAKIERAIQSVPFLSSDRRQAYCADLTLLRGIFTYWDGKPSAAITLLQAALEQQPPTHLFARAQAMIHLAGAYGRSGENTLGLRLLRTALIEAKAQQHPTMMILFGGLAIIHLQAGELNEVVHAARQAVAAVDELGGRAAWQDIGFVDVWCAWAHYLLGMVHYEQNDLAAATHHWRQVETMRYRTNPGVYHDTLLGFALIALANDAPAETLAYAQAAREFAVEVRRPNLLATSASFEVRLALLNDQTADALRQTQEIELTVDQVTTFGMELPYLTRLRALLAAATPGALTQALTLAATSLSQAENAHNALQVIRFVVLKALILHRLQRTEEAFDALANALTLGDPGRFVRTFLDLGAPMADLLSQFGTARGQSLYVKELLSTFPQTNSLAEHRALTAHYAKRHGVTPLTPREIELLGLIRQRLSIKEIAQALVISPNTVKKHNNNIYTKLGVRNRRAAVGKAEELGLLPPA